MTLRLRVAVVTKFPYATADGYSGLLQVSKNLCDGLAERDDVELHVVSGAADITQVEVHRANPYPVTFFPYGPDWRYYGTGYLDAARHVRRILHEVQPDIVHCQAIAETAIGSIWSKLPLVATIHGIAAAEAPTARSSKVKLAYTVQTMAENWYVPRLPHVITCSPYVVRFVRQRNPNAHLYDITNPIDPLFFAEMPAEMPPPYSILLVGTTAYRKGHDLMVEAIKLLSAEFPDVRLTVIGRDADPAFAHAVRQRIQASGIDSLVNWIGPVEQTQLLEAMHRNRILCLPSREETSPLTIAQAMAVGSIPVASDAGGIPDMLEHGVNGFMFPKGDAGALAALLAKVLRIPEAEVAAMRRRNRLLAEHRHRASSVAAQTTAVYRTILAGSASGIA
jgi:glycosyltransferase involved in cell wall biosynthesis